MDFMNGLPNTGKGHDAIWVIVDRLTKSVCFLLVRMMFSMDKLVGIYVKEIVRLHAVLVSLVSNQLNSRFHFCMLEELA